MNRTYIMAVTAAVLLFASAAEVQTREIEYKKGAAVLQGLIAWDDASKDRRPGVLVVHEWWGHNEKEKGDNNCLGNQVRRGAPAYSEARMPQLTDQRPRLPNSVSQPCDAGSMAHATVRACSECRRDDPRCPTVFEDLGYVGLSRLGYRKTYRERTPK